MTTFLHQRAMKHFFTFVLFTLATTAAFANNLTPVAVLGTEPAYPLTVVYQGKTVVFTAAASYDPDASNIITAREWKIGSTGAAVAGTGSTFTVTFTGSNGLAANETSKPFTVYLRVKDNEGTWSSWKSLTFTLKRQQDSGSVYYLTDHIGNVRATVDHNGNLLGWDDFYPFGGVMPGRSMNAANPNDIYKFTGHERDAEIGLDYMLARNYDPEIGRFLSVDPLFAKYPSLSPFSYVANNPLVNIDEDGRSITRKQGSFSNAWAELKNGNVFAAAKELYYALNSAPSGADLLIGGPLVTVGSKATAGVAGKVIPKWKLSEWWVKESVEGGIAQKRFLNNGSFKGSSVVDVWDEVTLTAFEVKNYAGSLAKGNTSGLVSKMNSQFAQRLENLPEGAKQVFKIDMTEFNLSKEMQEKIKETFLKGKDGNRVAIEFFIRE
jgi:RHS repeat-associated protein